MGNDDREIFPVWERIPNSNISDMKDLVGFIHSTWGEADEIIDKMNLAEQIESRRRPFSRGYGLNEITLKNCKEWVTR